MSSWVRKDNSRFQLLKRNTPYSVVFARSSLALFSLSSLSRFNASNFAYLSFNFAVPSSYASYFSKLEILSSAEEYTNYNSSCCICNASSFSFIVLSTLLTKTGSGGGR